MPKTLVFLDSFKRRCPSQSRLICNIYDFFFKKYYDIFYSQTVIPQIKKLSREKKVSIIAMDFLTEKRLERAGIRFKRLADYNLEKIEKEAEEESMKFAESIPNMNSQLKEAVSYKGISLWEMDIIDIWESFLLPIVRNINVISAIIRIERPDRIIVFDKTSELGRALKNICVAKKIKFSDATPLISHVKSLTLWLGTSIALKTFGECMRDVKNLRSKRTSAFPSKNLPRSDAILVTNSARIVKLTIPWAKRLHRCSFEVIGLSDSDKKPYADEKINYTPFSFFVDKKLNEEIDIREKELREVWSKNKNDFIAIKYRGVPINNIVCDLFEFLFKVKFPELILYIGVTERLIKAKKPKLIILYDCWNYFVKTILNSARQNGVKTLFIQHGVLSDIPLFSKTNVDAMALYGEDTKKILVKRGNEPEKMFLTGNIQLDYVANKRFDAKKTIKKLNLSKNKKTIVFLSQPLPEQEISPVLHELFDAAKKLPEVQLLIKLHPAESPKIINQIMKETESNATIIKNVSVGEVLSVADVAIAMTSTTYLDALALGKPLIIMKLLGEDVLPCVKDGAALGVYKKGQLISALTKALYDKKTIKKLAENRKGIIKRYAYKIDGKASERIVELVEKMLK